MTAAPGPHFRDQLAETLRSHRNLGIREGEWTCACGRQFSVLDGWLIHRADALLPVIVAEVEARVQAAAAQRAAEASWQGGATALDGAAAVLESQDAPAELVPGIRFAAQVLRETGQQYAARADALAQPADGGGER